MNKHITKKPKKPEGMSNKSLNTSWSQLTYPNIWTCGFFHLKIEDKSIVLEDNLIPEKVTSVLNITCLSGHTRWWSHPQRRVSVNETFSEDKSYHLYFLHFWPSLYMQTKNQDMFLKRQALSRAIQGLRQVHKVVKFYVTWKCLIQEMCVSNMFTVYIVLIKTDGQEYNFGTDLQADRQRDLAFSPYAKIVHSSFNFSMLTAKKWICLSYFS